MTACVSWAQQEDKSLPLQWCQIKFSDIHGNPSDSVPIVYFFTNMFSRIARWECMHLRPPGKIWREIFLILNNFFFTSQLIIKRISFLFLEPIRNLLICHQLSLFGKCSHLYAYKWICLLLKYASKSACAPHIKLSHLYFNG